MLPQRSIHSLQFLPRSLSSTLIQLHNNTQQLRYQSTNDIPSIPRYMITSAPTIAPHKIIGTTGLVQGNTVYVYQ